MTISSTYSPAQASGNGVTTGFPFTFKTFAETDLVVVLTSSAGVETTKTLTTHYTVSLNADQNNNPGGTVTMLTAPANGETLTIARELSALQETDIANGGGFYPEVLEDAFDRLTMLSQQNADILARSLRSSVAGGAVGDLPTVADRASKYLAFDANGDPVATSGAGSSVVISTFAETLLDDTTAAGMRTTLGLAIGTNVQAYNATLAAIASQTEAANKVQYYTADNTPGLLDFKDEDNMTSDSATAVPSQQSVKAYVDTQVATAVQSTQATQVSASGVAVDFTGIPAGVTRITVMFNGVSLNDTDPWLVQIGDSGGFETTGYESHGLTFAGAAAGLTTGFNIASPGSTIAVNGEMTLTLMDAATNTWIARHLLAGTSASSVAFYGAGAKSLSATLDRIRITADGVSTFDAGTINIRYEY